MGEKLQTWKKRLCGWHVGHRMPPGITGTSWLIKNQLVYIAVRFLMFFYMIAALAAQLRDQEIVSPTTTYGLGNGVAPFWTYWIFNTNWSYTLLAWYMFIAVIQSALVYRKKPEHFGHWETYIWAHFQLTWAAAWTVTFGFWVLLVGIGCGPAGNCKFNWYSWNGHGINTVVILIEAFLNQMPFHSLHVWAPIIYCGAWEILSVIWWSQTGYWTYAIQDPKGFLGGAAYLFYPLMILLYIIFFFWGKLFQNLLNRIPPFKRMGKLPAEWYEEERSPDKSMEMQP